MSISHMCPYCRHESIDCLIDGRGYKVYRCTEYDCSFYKECSQDDDLIEEMCQLFDNPELLNEEDEE